MPQHPQQSQKPAKHHEMFQNLNYIANNALAAQKPEQTHKNKYMQIWIYQLIIQILQIGVKVDLVVQVKIFWNKKLFYYIRLLFFL